MRIRVGFTLNVDPVHLPALKELAQADDAPGVAEFVRAEARQYLVDYLDENGVPATVLHEH